MIGFLFIKQRIGQAKTAYIQNKEFWSLKKLVIKKKLLKTFIRLRDMGYKWNGKRSLNAFEIWCLEQMEKLAEQKE